MLHVKLKKKINIKKGHYIKGRNHLHGSKYISKYINFNIIQYFIYICIVRTYLLVFNSGPHTCVLFRAMLC